MFTTFTSCSRFYRNGVSTVVLTKAVATVAAMVYVLVAWLVLRTDDAQLTVYSVFVCRVV